MAQCSIDALLSNGKCFAAMPPFILLAAATEEWCAISEGSQAGHPSWVNPDEGNAPIFNPDSGGVIKNPDL